MSEELENNKRIKHGKKTYVFKDDLIPLAESVASEHNIDIKDVKIKYALCYPECRKGVAGMCMLIGGEYRFFSDYDYLISFSGELWDRLPDENRRLLVAHELMHVFKVTDENGVFKRFALTQHDIQDFRYLVDTYGTSWLNHNKKTLELIGEIKDLREATIKLNKDKKKEEAIKKKQEKNKKKEEKEEIIKEEIENKEEQKITSIEITESDLDKIKEIADVLERG